MNFPPYGPPARLLLRARRFKESFSLGGYHKPYSESRKPARRVSQVRTNLRPIRPVTHSRAHCGSISDVCPTVSYENSLRLTQSPQHNYGEVTVTVPLVATRV